MHKWDNASCVWGHGDTGAELRGGATWRHRLWGLYQDLAPWKLLTFIFLLVLDILSL